VQLGAPRSSVVESLVATLGRLTESVTTRTPHGSTVPDDLTMSVVVELCGACAGVSGGAALCTLAAVVLDAASTDSADVATLFRFALEVAARPMDSAEGDGSAWRAAALSCVARACRLMGKSDIETTCAAVVGPTAADTPAQSALCLLAGRLVEAVAAGTNADVVLCFTTALRALATVSGFCVQVSCFRFRV
jgi:hypothetical protein